MTATDAPTIATTTIRPSELRRLREQDPDVRILDVRTGAEFESVHIPGSFNVPLDVLGRHVRRLADVDRPVILVCQTGARATSAREQLDAAGKSDLRVLEGGMGAWTVAGGDVVEGEEKWALERQVRGVAGSIVLGSILAGLKLPKLRFLAAGVGFGLVFSAVTNTCTMGVLLGKLPYNRGAAVDVDRVIGDMQH